MRGKVQLVVLLGALALAAPQVPAAHAAQYGVTTCAGQAAGVGGWSGFTRGSHPAKLQETCATGGVMYAALQGNVATSAGDAGWQLAAPAATSIAGATLVRKLVVAGTRYTYTARALTPAAANTQNFESCLNPAGCKDEIARGSLTWTSPRADVNRLEVYVSCAPTADVACQKVAGAEAAAVRISRADITLNDTTVPTISSPPSSPMFATGDAGQRCAGDRRVLQGHRRWHRLDRHPGRRTDGERGPRPKLDLSHALSPARPLPPEPVEHAAVQSRRGARRSAPAARLRPRRDRIQRRLLAGLRRNHQRPRRRQRHQRLRPSQAHRRRTPRRQSRPTRAADALDDHRPLQRQDRRRRPTAQQRRPAGDRRPSHRRHRRRPRRARLRRPAGQRRHRRQGPLQGHPPPRTFAARARPVLRPRARHHARRDATTPA